MMNRFYRHVERFIWFIKELIGDFKCDILGRTKVTIRPTGSYYVYTHRNIVINGRARDGEIRLASYQFGSTVRNSRWYMPTIKRYHYEVYITITEADGDIKNPPSVAVPHLIPNWIIHGKAPHKAAIKACLDGIVGMHLYPI